MDLSFELALRGRGSAPPQSLWRKNASSTRDFPGGSNSREKPREGIEPSTYSLPRSRSTY
jgi:hypothetical protein